MVLVHKTLTERAVIRFRHVWSCDIPMGDPMSPSQQILDGPLKARSRQHPLPFILVHGRVRALMAIPLQILIYTVALLLMVALCTFPRLHLWPRTRKPFMFAPPLPVLPNRAQSLTFPQTPITVLRLPLLPAKDRCARRHHLGHHLCPYK